MSYQLSVSQKIAADLRRLGDLALAQSQIGRFLDAVREVLARLTDAPDQWGDPLDHYPNLGLTRYRRACGVLLIEYSVDPTRRLVYLQRVCFLPGCGLTE